MIQKLMLFLGFALLTMAMGAVLHEDHRYPEYILSADTPCIANGSFRHPSNCSWFYKCESKTAEGYFQKQFFECAPGTVFDEALDICLPKSADGQSCASSGLQETSECKKLPFPPAGYCYPGAKCQGSRNAGGLCHYRVACTEQSVVVYCDMNVIVEGGAQCTNDSNAICTRFGKGILRF
ncbi:uncharacterized protein [Palaemon carinicauda]|uniref:uncharacterized protein n=1 Tax=Palaemon carinicauda TaxID=392227 RepID=UPI0035B623CC